MVAIYVASQLVHVLMLNLLLVYSYINYTLKIDEFTQWPILKWAKSGHHVLKRATDFISGRNIPVYTPSGISLSYGYGH